MGNLAVNNKDAKLLFQSHIHCWMGAFAISFLPYCFYTFPNFMFNRSFLNFIGVFLFLLLCFYTIWFARRLYEDTGKKVSVGGPRGVFTYPLLGFEYSIDGRVPKYAYPILIIAKVLLVWVYISLTVDFGG